jgi:hypothetical protein
MYDSAHDLWSQKCSKDVSVQGGMMRIKTPRWLLILEAVLFLGSIVILAYKAATRVLPLRVDRFVQKRGIQKPASGPTILDYYRQYPDRYIRVDDETWSYDWKTQVAVHSFALRNLATVAYREIEVRFTYQSASGKTVLTRDAKVPGVVPAQGTLSIKNFKVAGVPLATRGAVATVAKALMVQ